MKNVWQKFRVPSHISQKLKKKIKDYPLISIFTAVSVVGLITGISSYAQSPNSQPTSTELAIMTSTPTITPSPHHTPTTTTTPTPTPDMTRIMSPRIASFNSFYTPTPRPTEPFVSGGELVAQWPPSTTISKAVTSIEGTLTSNDGLMFDGTYFDLYEFEAEAGQSITVDLTSTQFDTVLALLNSKQEIIAYNDDGDSKNSTNSHLTLFIPHTDSYQIIVNSYEEVEGTYTLSLMIAEPKVETDRLSVGTPMQGWLIPGDETDGRGLYTDTWQIEVQDEPLVVWARSTEFDIRLNAFDSDGNLLVKNGDLNPIGRKFDARILLQPDEDNQAEQIVTLKVSLQGQFAIGGAYELLALPIPLEYEENGVIKIRPIVVKGADGLRGSRATPEQITAVIERANEFWKTCGINVVMERDEIETIHVPGLEYTVGVQSTLIDTDWTPEENLLMFHESHALPNTGIITVYFVRQIDEGIRYGLAYPSLRYAPQRSGMILVGDNGIKDEPFWGTLAHEIGHILGLNHPDRDDGDSENDTLGNLMFTSGGMLEYDIQRVYGELTPLQCMIARAAPHFVHSSNNSPLVPAAFQRTDAILYLNESVTGSLITRDAVITEAEEQFLDVYYFNGQAGDEVTIDLVSTDFDPILILEGPDETQIATDDDSGQGQNAHITIVLPETGDYSIGVTSYMRAVGAYTLSLSSTN